MNFHKEGDLLEEACKAELLRRWKGSRFIETKINSIHGIDFAIELAGGGVGIIESKSQSGSVKNPQMSVQWIRSRINDELYRAIVRAVKLNRSIFYATFRTSRKFDPKDKSKLLGFNVRSASPTGELKWQDLFPGEPIPSKEQWKMVSQQTEHCGHYLIVTHTLKDGSAKQINEYKIAVRQLSKAIYDSTISFKTFPFNVPHSHKITEKGTATYNRSIDEWDEHAAHKDLLDNSTVQRKFCPDCRTSFFDTSSHQRCYACFGTIQSVARIKAINLCEAVENS
jgi:hypothetical protein